jgi:Zn-dependent protease
MLRRQLANRLRLGRFLGIDLFIHWTFWLLMIGVGGSQLVGSDWRQADPWLAAGFAMAQIGVLFLCVTLHEYGHALMARRFGVRTVDITLLPIGGLARLERMPRQPLQEFLIAVAGPAVNVVIAVLTAVALAVLMRINGVASVDGAIDFIAGHFLGALMLINVALVVFNMVPAFPMDGGRVLRSFLATFLSYAWATHVASRVGFVIGLAMAALGILNGQWMVVLIAAFIGYAGWAEARQVALAEALAAIRIEDWLRPVQLSVGPLDDLQQLAAAFSATSLPSLPVLGVERRFLGLVDRARVAAALREGRGDLMGSDLMREDELVLEAPGALEPQLAGSSRMGHDPLAVVDREGRFLGLLPVHQVLSHAFASRRQRRKREEPIEAVLVESPPPASVSRY